MDRLKDFRRHNGSRYFIDLPQTEMWYEVCDHVSQLPGAQLTDFMCDDVTEAWIDFTFKDHQFSINDQFGEYWFFVENPGCPDEILLEVVEHFERLLIPKRSM